MARVVVIEDEPDQQEILRYNLGAAGHQVRVAATGGEGLLVAREERPDIVLLDLMLPDMPGTGVCKQLKGDAAMRSTRIIIVSAKGEEIDRVVGFELGADDYVVKPFSVRELLLRIEVVTGGRRPSEKASAAACGPLQLDREAHRVWVEGAEVTLTAIEFRLLATLYDRRSRAQGRDQLLVDVWGVEPGGDARRVDTHVKRLREKLGSAGRYIQTLRGEGYLFSTWPEE
jgi:two-component system, OmpR family, phosphate regulon response regulator PhoB